MKSENDQKRFHGGDDGHLFVHKAVIDIVCTTSNVLDGSFQEYYDPFNTMSSSGYFEIEIATDEVYTRPSYTDTSSFFRMGEPSTFASSATAVNLLSTSCIPALSELQYGYDADWEALLTDTERLSIDAENTILSGAIDILVGFKLEHSEIKWWRRFDNQKKDNRY